MYSDWSFIPGERSYHKEVYTGISDEFVFSVFWGGEGGDLRRGQRAEEDMEAASNNEEEFKAQTLIIFIHNLNNIFINIIICL